MNLEPPELNALLVMTPYAQQVPPERLVSAAKQSQMSITADFVVATYHRR
jgi:hypothetical protein